MPLQTQPLSLLLRCPRCAVAVPTAVVCETIRTFISWQIPLRLDCFGAHGVRRAVTMCACEVSCRGASAATSTTFAVVLPVANSILWTVQARQVPKVRIALQHASLFSSICFEPLADLLQRPNTSRSPGCISAGVLFMLTPHPSWTLQPLTSWAGAHTVAITSHLGWGPQAWTLGSTGDRSEMLVGP